MCWWPKYNIHQLLPPVAKTPNCWPKKISAIFHITVAQYPGGKPCNLAEKLNIPLSQTLVVGSLCGRGLLPTPTSWLPWPPPPALPQRPLFYPSIRQPKQSDKRGFFIYVPISIWICLPRQVDRWRPPSLASDSATKQTVITTALAHKVDFYLVLTYYRWLLST